MTTHWNKFALLCTGSREPGVCVVDVETNETHRALIFPEGDSAYSMAVAQRGDVLAVGTRTGNLFLISGEVEAMFSHPEGKITPIAFQSPILSLCFIGQDRLVVATASKTFWLNTAVPGETHDMETRGDIICALAAVSESQVFGLSVRGQLLGWAFPEGRCFRRQSGSPPGDVWGVVRLEHWASASALAYGAETGDLVLCSVQGKDCDVRPAHSGELYAIASSELYLLTAGRHDRRLKLWVRESPTPVADHPCPLESTSAAFITEDPYHVILVDTWGRAEVFKVGTEKLQFLASIPGNNHRVVNSPDLAGQRTERIAASAHEMDVIASKTVPELLAQERYEAVEPQCKRLDSLGYPHIALWFRADIAARQTKKLEELQFRQTLHKDYTQTDPWFEAARVKYADLLMDLWRFEEAATVFGKLAESKAHAECATRYERASSMAKSLKRSGVIADPVESLELLIRAASAIGNPFLGRWVVARKANRQFTGLFLKPTDVLAECRRQVAGRLKNITCVQEDVMFFSPEGKRKAAALVFKGPDRRRSSRLQFLIVSESYPGGYSVTPVIALAANDKAKAGDTEHHNNVVLAVLGATEGKQLRLSWIGEAVRVIGLIVEDIYSNGLSTQQKGDDAHVRRRKCRAKS